MTVSSTKGKKKIMGVKRVRLKAVKEIAPEHKAQVINYLKATKLKLALLVNFGGDPKATIIRLAL
jgi:GxxExxY protein